jgi:hypothetical protein
MPNRKPIKIQYQTLVIIWLALLLSQVVFLAFVYFTRPDLIGAKPVSDSLSAGAASLTDFLGPKPLITLAFAGSALVFFFLSQVLSRQHVRRAIRDHDASCVQTGLVLGCALSEISSILGLVLALAFDYPYFYLWIALGAFGIILNFPRKGSFEAASYTPSL